MFIALKCECDVSGTISLPAREMGGNIGRYESTVRGFRKA